MSLAYLPGSQGSRLCTLELWRRPCGRIDAVLVAMAPALIESTPGEPHQKMRRVAEWAESASASLLRQAEAFTPAEGDEA